MDRFGAYTTGHRVYELCGITATSVTAIVLASRLGGIEVWWIPIALGLGLLGADLVSGLVHWGFDTWGDIDTPVVGRLAIRAFREHHVDPTVMLRHGFVETNGHNITLALVLTAAGLAYVPVHGASAAQDFVGLCLFAMACFVSLTSQIHKWAHSPSPPRAVAWLQRAGIFLSPEHHALHHHAPHARRFCITTGWCDGLLDSLRIFSRIERLVAGLTGIAPRRDELHG